MPMKKEEPKENGWQHGDFKKIFCIFEVFLLSYVIGFSNLSTELTLF
jgi:hypothetical protein